MPQIGEFIRERDGFRGHIRTMTLACDVRLVATDNDPSDDKLPTLRVLSGSDEEGSEIGVAWARQSDKAGDYFSVLIDDPGLPQPIRANLFRNGNKGSVWALVWHRSPRRSSGN